MMKNGKYKIWLNGALLNADTPIVCATDRGFTLGDGLFETIKISKGAPCYLLDHFNRLRASAKVLSLSLPYGDEALRGALLHLARINNVTEGAARLTLSRGEGKRGLALPETTIPLCVLTLTTGLPHVGTPHTLGLSRIRRNSTSITSCHKTLAYIDNIAARLHQEGNSNYDDVVMLDEAGALASTTCANLFWWTGDKLYTPTLGGAVLPGTMRARVLASARMLGVLVHEGRYGAEVLLGAQGAFITNALIGVQRLSSIDFAKIGKVNFAQNAPTGPMAQLLSAPGAA
ncbi:MAG: 4-amino-4-deoxychorismate lyase [Robiginitomaculum sp.]|nr:MAG: 4-amino-4-deoxychorismate lyase [Robiginitomaculum sp.]